MKILHVYDYAVADPQKLIADIDSMIPGCTHTVMVQKDAGAPTGDYDKAILFKADEEGFDILLEQMKKADRIIWHGFSWRRKFLVRLYKEKDCLQKSIWHVSDNDAIGSQYAGKNPVKRVYHRFKMKCKGSMMAYATDSIAVYYRVKNVYGHNKKVYLVSESCDQELAGILGNISVNRGNDEPINENDEPINILIGSGGFAEQAYTKTLNLLSRFMFEDIRVHIPLSGPAFNASYIKGIKELAIRVFGDKAIFYEKPLSLDEKMALYARTNVGIFFHGAHHAAQDVLALSYLGKIVYCSDKLRADPVMAEIEGTLKRINDLPKEENVADLKVHTEEQMTAANQVDWEKVLRQLAEFDRAEGWKDAICGRSEEKQKIKYLHVIPPRQNIIQPFVSLAQKHFPMDEHFFLVSNKNIEFAPALALTKNVEFEMGLTNKQRLTHVFERLNEAEHVVFHSMYLTKWEVTRLAFSTSILKKAAWVEWGKDLYDYKKPSTTIKNRLHNYLHTRIREKIACFVSIFPPDELKFREQFRNQAPVLQTSYVAFNSIDMLEKTRPTTEENDNSRPVRIQVAHSCNSWNNHRVILDSLAHFKFENIELQIPLSTGSPPHNKKVVEKHAQFLFAHKANFLWKEMDKENYFKFMWSVDIAVFCLYRQAALGNIIRLLYMGKKVFLPKDSVMYNFFTENGVEIYDTEAIPHMTYEEFTAPMKTKAPNPFIVKMMHEDDLAAAWSEVFQYLQNNT